MPFYTHRNIVVTRVVAALRLMHGGRPTLSRLAREMGTTERTARRYVESFQAAGVPIRRHGPHYRIEGRL